MKQQSNILLMTKDNGTASTLNEAVKKSPHAALMTVCQEIPELTNYWADAAFQAVVVDIDPDPLRILHDVGTITTMYPEMRIVVVSNRFDNELILQAMQSGARYFLCKKTMTSELDKVLKQMAPNGAKDVIKSGSIVSVISASGGCGATTVAINLANELRLVSSEEVLVVDLDSYYGTVSSYLGISAEYGISNVLARNKAIDEHLVKSCAYNYMRDFHVLVSNSSLESSKPASLQYENIIPVLEACKKAYRYVVIDAPRLTNSAMKNLVSASGVVLVVFQFTVKDVKFARSLISSIHSCVPSRKIIPLVNRFKKRGSLIGLEDGKRILGLNCLYHVRSDWRRIANCINCGKPLAEVAPRSGLRKDFQKLTANIMNLNGSNVNGKIIGQ